MIGRSQISLLEQTSKLYSLKKNMLINCYACNGSGRMIDRIVYARNEETGFEIASEPFETDCIACDGTGKEDAPDDYYDLPPIELGNYDENL